MKAMRLILMVAVMAAISLTANAEKKSVKTIRYNVGLHCSACQAKVEKNIPYEKGVKDLKVDLDAKTVTVTFREDKNTVEGIQKAIEKLGYEVSGHVDVTGNDNAHKMKETGDTTQKGKEHSPTLQR